MSSKLIDEAINPEIFEMRLSKIFLHLLISLKQPFQSLFPSCGRSRSTGLEIGLDLSEDGLDDTGVIGDSNL